MALYTKLPVTIEAIQFNGSTTHHAQIVEWIEGKAEAPEACGIHTRDRRPIFMKTNHGPVQVDPNDWIIKGIDGEFYPCKWHIFEKTYKPAK